MYGFGPDEKPTVEERLAALEELARVAVRTDARGSYVASAALAAVDALKDEASAMERSGQVRRAAGVRAALKRLVGA